MGDPTNQPPNKRARLHRSERVEEEEQQTRREFYIEDITKVDDSDARKVINKFSKYLMQRVQRAGVQHIRIETHPTRTTQWSEPIPITSTTGVRYFLTHLRRSLKTLRTTESLKQDLATLSNRDVQDMVTSMTITVGSDVSPPPPEAIPYRNTRLASPPPAASTSNASPPPVASTSRASLSPLASTSFSHPPTISQVSLPPIASRSAPGHPTVDEGERTFNVNNVTDRPRTTAFLGDVRRYLINRLQTTANALDVWIDTSPNATTGLATKTMLDSAERVDSYLQHVEQEIDAIRELETLRQEANTLIINAMSVHIRRHAALERPAGRTFTIPDIQDESNNSRVLSAVQEFITERIQAGCAQNIRIETFPSVDEQLAHMSTTIDNAEQSGEYLKRVSTRMVELAGIEAIEQDLIALDEMPPPPREGRIEGLTMYVTDHVEAPTPPQLTWGEIETAFRRRITTGVIRSVAGVNFTDPRRFLEAAYALFEQHVQHALQSNAVKVSTSLRTLHHIPHDPETTQQELHFNTHSTIILATTDLQQWYDTHIVEPTLAKMETFLERGSGWTLGSILALFVNINRYDGMNAGCSTQLPLCIRNKGGVVNVQSREDDCFAWAVMAGLCRNEVRRNAGRSSSYPHYTTRLNLHGTPLPMQLHHLAKFEQQNDLSIHVYALKYKQSEDFVCMEDPHEGDKQFMLVPIYISPTPHHEETKHVNLLLTQYRCATKYHYSWIRDLSRLIRSSFSRHTCRIFVCDRCLSYFTTDEKFQTHRIDCVQFAAVKSVMPTEEEKYMRFTKHSHSDSVPFVVYADIECTLVPLEGCMPADHHSYTMKINQHKPHSVAYYLHCSYDNSLSRYEHNSGTQCITWFVQRLIAIAQRVGDIYNREVPLQTMTDEQIQHHYEATVCYLCREPFREEDPYVTDHCHLTGRYLGAAHNSCNLNRKLPNFLPVVMHNLSGYDAHFVITELSASKGTISLLPTTMEKYKGFTKTIPRAANGHNTPYMRLRFIDSFNFLCSSLDACAASLTNNNKHITLQHFPEPVQFEHMCQKGVFPYEYITHIDVLKERSLPPRDAFHSTLSGEGVTEGAYERAQLIWNTFQCNTLQDYSDLYLKSDVLLLADVFENFRRECMQSYGLDPAHYYTSPALAWSALLKVTGVTLELLTDIEMLQFVERGVRGGIVQCSHRHAKANNAYMPDHNPDQPSSYLMYFDVTNLYGWSMTQFLPTGNFRWLSDTERDTLDVQSVADDASNGYIFEVDLHYPQALHERHRDYPLCPQMMHAPTEQSASRPPKLLCTLFDKKRYVIHYRQLKTCIQEGMVIERVHRVLQFEQSAWMKPYIEINAEKRKHARNKFESDLYKLLNNAVFGRTLMNVRKMRDIKILTRWSGRYGASRLIAKPNFRKRTIFTENCMGVEMARVAIVFNKPIYVGMAILDISKSKMCQFHYEYMMEKYPDKDALRMCYTDTDSFIYHIKTDNVYTDIAPDVEQWFDTGDYDPDNDYGIQRKNMRVMGKMKDDLNGDIFREFIGVRAKMYAIETVNKVTCRAKGVKSSVSKHLTLEDYRTVLHEQGSILMRIQHCIRSDRHSVYTVRQNKIALSSLDDKRYIEEDGVTTLPWGHFAIPSEDA